MKRSRIRRATDAVAIALGLALGLAVGAGGTALAAPPESCLERAIESVRQTDYRYKKTPHLELRTDDPGVGLDRVEAVLEHLVVWFEESWGGALAVKPFPGQLPVFLFDSDHSIRQLHDAGCSRLLVDRHGARASQGAVLHARNTFEGEPETVVVNRTAYLMIEHRLFDADNLPPRWLVNGLGYYYGLTKHKKNGFQPGKIGGKGFALVDEGKVDNGTFVRGLLGNLREQLKKTPIDGGTLIGLVQDGPAPTTSGSDFPAREYLGWLLVHWSLHSDDDRAARFRSWVAALAGGSIEATGYFDALGVPAEDVAARLPDYAGTIK